MNILLTGERNIGKSTIIDEFLKQYTGNVKGYRTVREKTPLDEYYGVYLLDVNDGNPLLTKKNKAGDCYENKSLVPYKDVFDTLGVKLLSDYDNADIIIMDEIGVLERDAEDLRIKLLNV